MMFPLPRSALAVIAMLATMGCGVALDVPDEKTILCVTTADCPDRYVCATAVAYCIVDRRDTEGPRLVGISATDAGTLVATFDEAVAASSANDARNYSFEPPLAVSSVTLDGDAQVAVIVVNGQVAGQLYTAHVSAVTDFLGNPIADGTATFVGSGVLPDRVPPQPLAPADGATTAIDNVVFAWTAPTGAEIYSVVIARDPALLDPIPGSPFEVAATSFVLPTLPDVSTFYWSVIADVSTGGAAVLRLEAIDEVLRVFCAAGDDCSESKTRPEAGNRTHPYRSLTRAAVAAAQRGAGEIRIAARGSGVAYDERAIVSSPVEISGGWDATFTAQNDAPTLVTSTTGTPLRIGFTPGPTLVRKLILSTLSSEPALRITGADDRLTVRDCDITGGTTLASVAVLFESASGSAFENNTVDSGASAQAIVLNQSAVRIVGNVIDATTPCLSCNCRADACLRSAVRVQFGGGPSLSNNTINANGASELAGVLVTLSAQATLRNNVVNVRNTGVTQPSDNFDEVRFVDGVRLSGNATAVLESNYVFALAWGNRPASGIHVIDGVVRRAFNNVVHAAASGPPPAVAIYAPTGWGGEITNNTLAVSATGASVVVQLGQTSLPGSVMANNILVAALAGSDTVGVYELGGRPGGFVNNVILNISKAYVVNSVVTEPSSLDDPAGDGARFTGNLVIPSAAIALDDVFVDLAGPDGDVATFEDNDYHLLLETDPFDLKHSALDLTTGGALCYSYAVLATCAAVGFDRDGVARTAAMSVGAFEKD